MAAKGRVPVALGCVLFCAGGCHTGGPRLPVPEPVREFTVPWENAFPSDAAVDAGGRVWFTDRLTHVIGRFDPETREFASFPTPTPRSAPYGMVAGPDGGLWFAESQAGRLGRVDPADGVIREYVLRGVSGGPQLLARAGGRLWFTVREGRAWGWYDPESGEVVVYPGPEGFGPYGIAASSDGSIWIGGQPGWMLVRVDGGRGTATILELESEIGPGTERWLATLPDSLRERQERRLRRQGQSRRIAVDGDGGVWLTDFQRSRVVRYDPRTGGERAYASLSGSSGPYGIAVSRTGLVWYSETGTRTVVALDPSTGERRSFPLASPKSMVRQIVLDEVRGRVWLPMSDAGKLGLIELAR
jgi:virginiamycin B lyase